MFTRGVSILVIGESRVSLPHMKSEQTDQPAWKSFWALLVLQSQNAFNDKMAQFLIIPLSHWLFLELGGDLFQNMPHLLAVLIVLPYLMMAPFAGWLSDRYAKSSIVRWSAALQTLVLAGMGLAVWYQSIMGVVAAFFVLSIQSTILNPAKRGLVKELVGEKNLGSASGILEMSVVLSVCVGQIVAGFWFAHEHGQSGDGWQAMQVPLAFLLIATLIPIVLSFRVKNTGAQGAEPWTGRQMWGHFGQMKRIFGDQNLRRCSLGKSFFWGFAGILNLWQISLAKGIAASSGEAYGVVLSVIMIAASGGIVLGGVVASFLSRRQIQLGLVPIGVMLMLTGTVMLACDHASQAMMCASFMVAGFGGAVYLVPINGQLQNLAPSSERGKILAGASVLDCLMGLSAVAIQLVMSLCDVPIWGQCVIIAVVLLGVLVYTLRILAPSFVRLLVQMCFRNAYKVAEAGIENIPAEGGVLLTPNHVSYVDTLVLSVASPRPVRFLMVRDCFDTPGVGAFANLFDTIPISRERAKEAISSAAAALDEGTVVCIFPEGQLTRSGALCELKRGFQMIARRAGAPVVPVYMDGLWGTMTSFEREKMIYKVPRALPYGTRVHFGPALQGREEVTAERLGQEMHRLSHDAIMARRELRHARWIQRRLRRAKLPTRIREQFSQLSWEELRAVTFNAMQLRELGVFRDKMAIGYERGCEGELVICVLAALLKGSVREFQREGFDLITGCDFLFVGDQLRSLKKSIRNCAIIDINGELIPEGELGPTSYPAKVENGHFLTFSMPHPNKIKPHDPLQPGWKPLSYGRVLPGTKELPAGLDEEFFLF